MLPSDAEIVRGYTAHSCIISILSILENWLHFPFFTGGILLLGPQGGKHQNYAPAGLRRIGWTPDMVELFHFHRL